ncbi:alcohol dehydrogenase catalytic domain-containing protein [Streptomyces sp. NPDC003077]|uniref:alcohol dehydrogenase catalytic domain-containing protein n=1 Tax=Streptomyces sp. NPDC003077 TaxID=3154443 RepID=UPI0033AACC01
MSDPRNASGVPRAVAAPPVPKALTGPPAPEFLTGPGLPEEAPHSTMLAAVLDDIGRPLVLERRPRPVAGAGEAVIRVRAAGLCHTDLHLAAGIPTAPRLPLVLGHEIAGEVVELGEGAARSAGLAVGDRVLAYYYQGCGVCRRCARGLENLCPTPLAKWGFDTDGGFAEYFLAAARCLVPVPPEVSLAEAAVLGCSGTTALHVVRSVAKLLPGEAVAVVGAGGVGLACVQAAVARGARVVAFDPRPAGREAALRYGALAAVDPSDPHPVGAMQRASHMEIHRCDVVVDTVGSTESLNLDVLLADLQGRVAVVGYTGRPVALDVFPLVSRETAVLGSVGATLADAREVVRLAAAGELRGLIAAEYPLDRINEALDRLARGAVTGRLVIVP